MTKRGRIIGAIAAALAAILMLLIGMDPDADPNQRQTITSVIEHGLNVLVPFVVYAFTHKKVDERINPADVASPNANPRNLR